MTAEWLPMTSAALMDTIAAKDAIIRDQAERLDVYETALEAERQWRLKSLPALLAAEAKAARCVCHDGGPSLADIRNAPELTPAARVMSGLTGENRP